MTPVPARKSASAIPGRGELRDGRADEDDSTEHDVHAKHGAGERDDERPVERFAEERARC
jgi:hypothetical protein